VAHAAQGIDEKLLRAKLHLALTSPYMDQQLNDINERLDKLTDFLRDNMVTKQELQEMRDDLPTRAEFAQLQTSVDGIAKQFKNSEQELLVVGERTARMEKWIQRAADKIGLEYKP
jgi:phosphopantetheine adenylyltransferase